MNNLSSASRTARIPTLDGWRAVAILGVIWYHAVYFFYTDRSAPFVGAARMGAFGVDVFFGLSGMLITGLLLQQWGETGAISLKAFYMRRVFRILPIYLVFLVVIAAMGRMYGFGEFASCLLFFRNYYPGDFASRETAHLWSLSVEEHFYLIWPALLVLCGVKRGRHVASCLAIALGFWRLIESQMRVHWFPDVPPLIRTDLRMDAILWGCVVAFTLNDANARERLRVQLQFWPWLGAVTVAAACMIYYSNLTSMFLAVLIPIVIAGTLLHPEWMVSRLLDCGPMAWVGRISYSLYVWQQPFLVPGFGHPSSFATRLPWNLAVVLAIACASYYFVETPLMRVGARRARQVKEPLGLSNVEPVARLL